MWWHKVLGSPRHCCAPMVLQSELAFRMLVRKHGCSLCYAPMLPVAAFLSLPPDGPTAIAPVTGGPATQAAYLTTCETDRPLLAQLGGADPAQMLAAALLIQDKVDGVDINFGCPQACAATAGYGAFLLDQPERARAIVEALVGGLRVPVTAKMRIFPELADTLAFARMLEEAGVAALAVHGRRREQRHHEGAADLEAVAAVKAALRIPVISNGNVRSKAEADAALAKTGCDCVMSATALLCNPRLFADEAEESAEPPALAHAQAPAQAPAQAQPSGAGRAADGVESGEADGRGGEADVGEADSGGGEVAGAVAGVQAAKRASMALEYLECCKTFPDGALPRMISDHLMEMLKPDLLHSFNADERKEIKAHRTTTRPAQFAGLVRRVQAHGAFHEQMLQQNGTKGP